MKRTPHNVTKKWMSPRGVWPWDIQIGPFGIHKIYICNMNFYLLASHMHNPFSCMRKLWYVTENVEDNMRKRNSKIAVRRQAVSQNLSKSKRSRSRRCGNESGLCCKFGKTLIHDSRNWNIAKMQHLTDWMTQMIRVLECMSCLVYFEQSVRGQLTSREVKLPVNAEMMSGVLYIYICLIYIWIFYSFF